MATTTKSRRKAHNIDTTSQKRAKLKQLGRDTQRNLFDMLELVDEILGDHVYIEESFGDEGKALDHFEETDFAHFGGNPSLGAMLRAYRHTPNRAVWEEYSFNVRAMIDLATPAKNDKESNARTNWRAKCIELEAEVKRLAVLNHEMRERLDQLLVENGELRGQMKATAK